MQSMRLGKINTAATTWIDKIRRKTNVEGFRRICVVHSLVPEHAERQIRKRCMSHNFTDTSIIILR